MSDENALALWLADWIESEAPPTDEASCADVAAELRRLYAEIERLTAAWHCQHVRKVEERAEAKLWFEHAQKLHAVNAELLEALKDAAEAFEILANGGGVDAYQYARLTSDAVAKAEGKS